jgi:7,8-dihydropterin-6-yl-methyl-4-(beta-D-ribofuranosyl)aminobenzene 5'-phosphate synthase
MKLTVLVDNNTKIDRYLLGEPALSFYLEDKSGELRVLFDTGYSDVMVRNAIKLGIDLSRITHLVLSHGHEDHTWGISSYIEAFGEDILKRTDRPTLVAHPLCLAPKLHNDKQIGFTTEEEKLRKYFNMELSVGPVWLSKSLVFLGEIERTIPFEGKITIGTTIINGKEEPDHLLDDSAMVFMNEKGYMIITGCSHSGICNIINMAEKIIDNEDLALRGIIGGLHMLKPDPGILKNTVQFIRRTGVKTINPCHCTDLKSRIALSKAAEIREVTVGSVIDLQEIQ